jgi:hypothetical protein
MGVVEGEGEEEVVSQDIMEKTRARKTELSNEQMMTQPTLE